jgi:phenylpropionate dioxygenase-like ring-hydroxylating dioxygenase large terminal subunit
MNAVILMNDLSSSPSPAGSVPSEWPPSWLTLQHGIRSGRYTDPDFLKLEFQKLWRRVWQAAARLDEIPEPGDYTVYDIGDQSVLIVRLQDNSIKAYHNVCPHRGTALAETGQGSFPYQRIVCPFHGWRWALDGHNEFVLERHEFRDGQLRDSDVALKEVRHEIFAGFVFINLDPKAAPFDEHIAPVRELLEGLAIDQMRNYWWKAIPIAANWKVAQEAFFEGYHVPATHPQLEPHSADFIYKPQPPDAKPDFAHWNVDYEVYPRGHGRFFGKTGAMKGNTKQQASDADIVDAMANRLNLLATGMDAQILAEDVEIARSLKGKPIPEGSSLGAEYVKAQFATAAAKQRPMPKPTPENFTQWGGEVFVFPNLLILPVFGNAMIYRIRPHATDPNQCTFEILSTKTYPAAEPVPRAVMQTVTDNHDPKQVLDIPRQDLGNIPRMQKGLHSIGCKQIWLASHNEKIILNMHQELDRYLA